MPKISIIIPNYNHANYLQERIESVLHQSFQNFEIIILDDNSTDNSLDVINQYKNHPKVKQILTNNENSGSTFKQWNKGINYASGEWIWIAESDDFCNDDFLEKVMKPIEDNKNIVLSYSQSTRVNSKGEITGSWLDWTEGLFPLFSDNFQLDGTLFIEKYLFNRNVIPNASAVVFNKNAFIKAGKTDENIKYTSDWLLWMKILLQGNIAFNAKPLNHFRYHTKSVIATATLGGEKPFKRKFDIIMLQDFNSHLNGLSAVSLKSSLREKLSQLSYEEYIFSSNHNNNRDAIKYALQHFGYSRKKIKSMVLILKHLMKKN